MNRNDHISQVTQVNLRSIRGALAILMWVTGFEAAGYVPLNRRAAFEVQLLDITARQRRQSLAMHAMSIIHPEHHLVEMPSTGKAKKSINSIFVTQVPKAKRSNLGFLAAILCTSWCLLALL